MRQPRLEFRSVGRRKSNFVASSRPPKPPPICTFCGTRPGKERGHVVPKCFFDVLPLINLTVPACAECERGRGDGEPREIHLDEEYMANVLCMDVASERHAEARQLIEKRVFRSFSNSPRMRNSVLRTIRPVELRNEAPVRHAHVHYGASRERRRERNAAGTVARDAIPKGGSSPSG
jgi:NMD protein affecting ribosome stability and mRNA decay